MSRGQGGGPGRGGLGYLPALDGLRAVAVAGVIAFHAGLPWAKGGFLGVDAFFVLSGYLITSLLLAEREATGGIGLGSFWARRARRLLPALFLMLAVVAGYGALAAPGDTLGQLRSDALFTLGYAANWHQIFSGQGYFAQLAQPSPLLHTWSLAIEEQFYLLWPLALLAVGRTRRPRRNLAVACATGALASAVEMALLYRPADTARVYFGTDTRAQSLLVGALLAALAAPRPGRRRLGAGARLGLAAGALAATGYLAWSWSSLSGASPFLYRGGFAAGAVAVAALIAATLVAPRGFAA
ncbi:MAG TPA: acyltransferase, partial [Acidimicrobiales bacterium]|nr:acyltransferase [Acidimicrobiales bacterium]